MFNLGARELFLKECHALGRGGDHCERTDIESLTILLHRALMSAQTDDTHAQFICLISERTTTPMDAASTKEDGAGMIMGA